MIYMICKTCGKKMVKTTDERFWVCPSPARHGKLIPVKYPAFVHECPVFYSGTTGASVPALGLLSPDKPNRHVS